MTMTMKNRRRLTVLVTGFGPFPGVTINPTDKMARRLADSRRFKRIGLDVVAHIFPTRWAAVARDLPTVLSDIKPDATLHLGVAARRRRISIETMARPSPSSIAPDSGGKSAPVDRDPSTRRPLRIAAPAEVFLASFRRNGAPTHFSNSAGRYLCNAIYHQSLSLREKHGDARPTLFIHVPSYDTMRSTLPKARLKTRKPTAAATMKGLEDALVALARAARARQAVLAS